MVFSFFHNRRFHTQLRIALEMELDRLPKPSKEGKTVDDYFQAMVYYVQQYFDRKAAFLSSFEKRNLFTFSEGYRRRYLAKCFDSLVVDLHKIVVEYLEIDFVLTLQRKIAEHNQEKSPASHFFSRLEILLLEKTDDILTHWYDEPLRKALKAIFNDADFDDKRRSELTRAHNKSYAELRNKAHNIIVQFCRPGNEEQAQDRIQSIYKERTRRLPRFLEQLRQQGFVMVDDSPRDISSQ